MNGLRTYASDQIDHLLPFMSREHGASTVTSLVTMFTIEHLMLAIVIGMRLVLDRDPAWVRLFWKRVDYKKELKVAQKEAEAKQAAFAAKMTARLFNTQNK